MISREFYKELGKLIYSLAKADGQIQPKEIEKLIEMLRATEIHSKQGEIIHLNEDKYYTEFEFMLCKNKKVGVKEAFCSFINFIKSNQAHIDDKMKQISLLLARKVLKSHKGINRLEQKMLDELTQVLYSNELEEIAK